MKIGQIITLLALVCGGATAANAQSADDDWKVQLTPYLWATYQKGTSTINNVRGTGVDISTDFDLDFGDILDNLEGALLIDLNARKSNWMFAADFVYLSLEDEEAISRNSGVNGSVTLGVKETFIDLMGGYRAIDGLQSDTYLYTGFRIGKIQLDAGVNVNVAGAVQASRSGSTSFDSSWGGLLLGVYNIWDLSENWAMTTRLELGTSGGEGYDSWLAAVGLNQKIGSNWTIHYGYRYLSLELDDDDFYLDTEIGGLLIGAGYTF